MKLTIKEANKICSNYNLGSFKSLKIIPKGAINYLYEVSTNEGVFIIKILGFGLNNWIKPRLKLQFEVIDYLTQNEFPYLLTYPLKNKNGNRLSKMNKKYFWVYKKIEGIVKERLMGEDCLEVAKVIAKFHKAVSKFKFNGKSLDFSWLKKEYDILKRRNPKTKEDKLFLEYADDFEKILKNGEYVKFKKNLSIIHMDFHLGNLVFNGKKIVGILDFDNIAYGPKSIDLYQLITKACVKKKFNISKFELIISEYKKSYNLKKYEEELILESILLRCCDNFWWVYEKMKKDTSKRISKMREIIKTKKVVEAFLGR